MSVFRNPSREPASDGGDGFAVGSGNVTRENIVEEKENKLIVEIKGNSFLKSQIRIIIGTALDIYFGNYDENHLRDMLENPKKDFLKKVADPYGLYLSEINY